MDEFEKLDKKIDMLRSRIDKLWSQIADFEATRFADRCELEMDLQRWDGIYAAHVGHKLEDVADRLTETIEAYTNDEDIYGELFALHMDVCCLMADVSTVG